MTVENQQTTPEITATTPDSSLSANSGNGTGTTGGTGQPAPIQMTSEQLTERLKRAQDAAVAAILKELGIENVDTLKGTIQKAKEAEAAQLSATERLQKDLEKAQNEAKTAREQLTALQQERQAERIDTAIRNAAADPKVKAHAPDDIVMWARTASGVDLATVLNEDGKVNEAVVKGLMDAVKKAKPHWFAAGGPGSPSNSGGRTVDPTVQEKEQAKLELRRRIRGM